MLNLRVHRGQRKSLSKQSLLDRVLTSLIAACTLFWAVSAFGAQGWSPAASLHTARWGHTATLMLNGKVLVAGGAGNGTTFADAELYDPTANAWTVVGALATPRSGHTATLLQNGKVLVVGGASAELFDPTTNTWSSAGLLASPRGFHTATLLLNGKVLVAGGNLSDNTAAEIYDPSTNAWTSVVSLPNRRFRHSAALLPTGKVLLAGGTGNQFYDMVLASTLSLDPPFDSGSWSAAGDLTTARARHTATTLRSGRVLIVGGWGWNGSYPENTELYDPAANNWTTAGAVTTTRADHTATLLSNGKVLAVGGVHTSCNPVGGCFNGQVASAELYDPSTNTWSVTAALGVARSMHTATLLPNGKVLVVGGFSANHYPTQLDSVELFDSRVAPVGSMQPILFMLLD